jgi:flagellin FlaB
LRLDEVTKMRKKFAQMRRDKRADIGIGTMIVFIAMVLVAAVAAAVLISTANSVREQATTTGDQAIGGVSSGFIHESVTGAAATATTITAVNIYVKIAAGSPPIAFENVMVHFIYQTKDIMLHYDAAAAVNHYTVTLVKGVSPFAGDWGSRHIIGQGDMVKISIANTDTGALSIANLKEVTFEVMPAMGQPCLVQFQTPEIFVSGSIVTLA